MGKRQSFQQMVLGKLDMRVQKKKKKKEMTTILVAVYSVGFVVWPHLYDNVQNNHYTGNHIEGNFALSKGFYLRFCPLSLLAN